MKKILAILQVPPPYAGGEIRSEEFVNFIKKNNTFLLFVIKRKKRNRNAQGGFSLSNIFYGIFLISKTFLLILKHRPGKLFTGLPKDKFSFLRTFIIIKFADLFGVKVFVELAGTSFLFLDRKSKFMDGLFRNTLKSIYSFRFLGNSIKKKFNNYSIRNTVVFDNGIKVNKAYVINRDVIFNETLNLLYVGGLEYCKGISILIDSILLCKKNNLKVKLFLMGQWMNSNEKNKIIEFIKENNLLEIIEFTGLKIADEKWKIFNQCALLVHPTFWDGQPIAILEAMGLGLGIISTNVGAIPDTIENNINGIVMNENTPENLYREIESIYFEREKLFSFHINNLKTFEERFSLKKYLTNTKNWLLNT